MRALLLSAAVISLVACTGSTVETDDLAEVENSKSTETSTASEAETPERAAQARDIETFAHRTALFGDTHIHTKYSFDAYIFGTRATPDDAYRFAKGEAIDAGAGVPIKLGGPPLDFLAVSDHGEYMGIIAEMDREGSALSQTEIAQTAFGDDPDASRNAFVTIGTSFVMGMPIVEIHDKTHMKSVWDESVDTANRHNKPGEFTTFAAYEYTAMAMDPSTQRAGNLHRNVIFRDAPADRPFSTLDSINPEDLWDWMDQQRESGIDLMSIPHNSNGSDGTMFMATLRDGSPMSPADAQQRLRNEPIVEISQVKGTSETHPLLAPNDEWAGHELYDSLIGIPMESKVVPGSFVRNALAMGMGIEAELGTNPFQFGVISASDTHVAGGSFIEDEFFGKFAGNVDPANRGGVPTPPATTWEENQSDTNALLQAPQYSASGLAGVWATSNTREAIFDAMKRRETFATSGPRIKIRLFMGDYSDTDLMAADRLDRAYAGGVPMGSIADASGRLMASAIADPASEPLERMQIIALRADGSEEIHDIACAGGVSINPDTNRCDLPMGDVDMQTCETSGAGAGELSAIWDDPNANPETPATYYLRVLERPKCRWSTWDAIRAGIEPNPDLPPIIQDRAWSSAIWVTPGTAN